MEKKLSPQNSETMNKIMAEAKPQEGERPRREFRKRPDIKINRPFEALAGLKVRGNDGNTKTKNGDGSKV